MTAAFTFQPASPLTGDVITFTDTSVVTNDTIASLAWDLDDDGAYDDGATSSVTYAYAVNGPHVVRLRVTTTVKGLTDSVSETVTVHNRPPTASFTYSPAFPATGQTTTFTSTSSDSDGGIETEEWDLDNDGAFDDAKGHTVTRAFPAPGQHIVSLRVRDTDKATAVATQTVVVGNRPPVASFVRFPASPFTGDVVTFVSTSSDPDTAIASQAWDLNGDGNFGDASGPSAARIFTAPGSYLVTLQVVDQGGLVARSSQIVVVQARAAGLAGSRGLPLLSPFPIVRIAGTITTKGIKLRRLIIDAPAGSRIVVRCSGRRCPLRRQVRTALGEDAPPRAVAARVVRIRRFERRLLRAGLVVRISITKPGTIGKFTRFKIRKRKPPLRIDRCLVPNVARPVRCPTS